MNKDTIRNIIIRALIFTILLIIVVLTMESFFYERPSEIDGWSYVYQDDIDVLIMGSSLAYSSFDCNILTDQLGKSTVILASGAQSIEQTYFNLKEVLKYQSPDIVVIEEYGIAFDTIAWMKEKNTTGLIFDNTDVMKMSANKYNLAFTTLGLKGYGSFQLMRQSGKLDRIVYSLNHPKEKIMHMLSPQAIALSPTRGSYLSKEDTIVSQYDYDRYLDKDDYDQSHVVSSVSLNYTNKIIKLCQKNNIDIVFVKVPMLKRAVSNAGHDQIVSYIDSKGYEVQCYNLMDEQFGFGINKADYADINHLSYEGALKVTHWLQTLLEEYYTNK